VSETFEQRRLTAVLRACRALRHEFATPLSAAALHLELARRAVDRASGEIPEKLRAGLEIGRLQVDEASRLLEGLTALGSAQAGRPGRVDFVSLVTAAAGRAGAELERFGLSLRIVRPPDPAFVEGFPDELEGAMEEALLTAARWAEPGECVLETGVDGESVSFAFRVPLAKGGPPGDMLFKTRSRPNAGLGPFISRFVFEAHGGRLEGLPKEESLVVTGSLPVVA
jgi:signal transduction histidine kinase